MAFRCLTGFNGERCETRDRAVSGRATQDEETAQTGSHISALDSSSFNGVHE